MTDVYIWRDRFDPHQFWLGTKSKIEKTYNAWIPVYIDAFANCFEECEYEEIKRLIPGGEPIPISLSLKIEPSMIEAENGELTLSQLFHIADGPNRSGP